MFYHKSLISQQSYALMLVAAAFSFTGQSKMAPEGTRYSGPTITVELREESLPVSNPPSRDYTAVLLLETGDADEAIVEAFYYQDIKGMGRLLLHKETTVPLLKKAVVIADLPLPISQIEFIRVKELRVLRQNVFGKEPKA